MGQRTLRIGFFRWHHISTVDSTTTHQQSPSLRHPASPTITPTWSLTIGEVLYGIDTMHGTNNDDTLVLLGEHHVWFVSASTGALKTLTKLDYPPLCGLSYTKVNGALTLLFLIR